MRVGGLGDRLLLFYCVIVLLLFWRASQTGWNARPKAIRFDVQIAGPPLMTPLSEIKRNNTITLTLGLMGVMKGSTFLDAAIHTHTLSQPPSDKELHFLRLNTQMTTQ